MTANTSWWIVVIISILSGLPEAIGVAYKFESNWANFLSIVFGVSIWMVAKVLNDSFGNPVPSWLLAAVFYVSGTVLALIITWVLEGLPADFIKVAKTTFLIAGLLLFLILLLKNES